MGLPCEFQFRFHPIWINDLDGNTILIFLYVLNCFNCYWSFIWQGLQQNPYQMVYTKEGTCHGQNHYITYTGKDSDTTQTKLYSQGGIWLWRALLLEGLFGKDYDIILTRWGLLNNSKNSKNSTNSKVDIPKPSKSPLPVSIIRQLEASDCVVLCFWRDCLVRIMT